MTPNPRPGLSLLEVLIALAIFLIAIGVLSHMINTATDRALEVQQQGQAAQLCQAKLAEIMVGAIELTSQKDVPLDEDPAFVWSMEPEQTDIPGLVRVNVRVSRGRPDGSRIECAMSQMIIEPSIRGSVFDNPSTASTDTGTGTTSSSSSTASSGSSGSSSSPSSGGSSSAQPGQTSGGTGSSSGPSRTPPQSGPTGTAPPSGSSNPATKGGKP